MTLFDVVSAVIEVTEDEHEAVAVVVHMLESGRVKLPRQAPPVSRSNKKERCIGPDAMRRAG
jgi:hypothetical protein